MNQYLLANLIYGFIECAVIGLGALVFNHLAHRKGKGGAAAKEDAPSPVHQRAAELRWAREDLQVFLGARSAMDLVDGPDSKHAERVLQARVKLAYEKLLEAIREKPGVLVIPAALERDAAKMEAAALAANPGAVRPSIGILRHAFIDEAWALIANVSEGDWTAQDWKWERAATRWRERYFAAYAPRCPGCPHAPHAGPCSGAIRLESLGGVGAPCACTAVASATKPQLGG